MGYRTLRECIDDLAAAGHLVAVEHEVDPYLEVAEIHRRVCRAGGPALYFPRVKGCPFPLVSNLFGRIERVRFMFRDTLAAVQRLVRLKAEPDRALARPLEALAALPAAWNMRPRAVRGGPALAQAIRLSELPQVVAWPRDGGPFITLPQVYTEDPDHPGWRRSNLGMYRIQLAGNRYAADREAGLHYQIHRGIGVHHAAALRRGEPLRVSVFVGGPPAMTVAAVMPLPEGLSELAFAGALGGRRVPLVRRPWLPPVHAEADFTLVGTIDPERLLPEGPFGDHLGYYALAHDFPVLRVERVFHRPGAVWPLTVVGRPPQEDSAFGQFIHELTSAMIPTVLPGVRAVHAVDAAGVHPLLLAVGSERYTPYAASTRPMELLTQAHAILGQGQMSLAKYLWIANGRDDPALDPHDVGVFLRHMLARVDWQRDVHFQTCTTIDTLDYSGTALNEGSKAVIAAVGPPRRELPAEVPAGLRLPAGYGPARVALPGVLVVGAPAWSGEGRGDGRTLREFCAGFSARDPLCQFPLVVLADDAPFTAATLDNFLWVTFTRSNPAADVDGVEARVHDKHWGCGGALVMDARAKPHHAPPVEEDREVARRVEALAARGGPLAGLF